MSQPPARPAAAPVREPTTIKKYANRRLYNTATSTYVTLENLCEMVKQGEEFNVYDAKTGEDLTRSVLTQIIVEEEAKGQNLLPISFLRQLIGFYGGNLQWAVPRYLEQSMQQLTNQQEQLRQHFQQYVQQTMGRSLNPMMPLAALEEMSKQNMVMLEQAMTQSMRLFFPFGGAGVGVGVGVRPNSSAASGQTMQEAGTPSSDPAVTAPAAARTRYDELKQRLADMQREVDALKQPE